MSYKLPDSIASPQDLMSLIIEIHEYSRWYQHEMVKHHIGAPTAVPQPTLSPAASAVISQWAAEKPLSQESLEALITMLETYRTTAPVITVTLAAPATRAIMTDLVVWCRANLAPDILVSVQFNATILGGMVVRYGSKLYDWSFRRQLLANRYKFPEILSRV